MSNLVRESALQLWLSQTFDIVPPQLTMVSGDASFRRYFRFQLANGDTAIAVDAPPATEKNQQFVDIAKALNAQNLPVPVVLAADIDTGFLCIEDLGSTMLEQVLSADNAAELYRQALALIVQLQGTKREDLAEMEDFDPAFIQRELDIFADWFAKQELQAGEEWQQTCDWSGLCNMVRQAILEQPYAPMHRDFHSRNLMLNQQQIVMIDFQDMVWGPIAYDVVSLLRDCYVAWPEELVDDLQQAFLSEKSAQLSGPIEPSTWQRWFDLTGLQRHIKALGIFCRLDYRDGKTAYREAIPQTLEYVLQVTKRYPELQAFHQWLSPIAKGFKV
jgi:aminoglycoside/choline kinase family phosphotransferase